MNIDKDDYEYNGYMNGMCSNCKEWEAPITIDELKEMPELYAHHGTSEKKVNKNSVYLRTSWVEYFQCPKCKHRFSVGFSNI